MIGAVVVTFSFSIALAEYAVYEINNTRSDVSGFYVGTGEPPILYKLGTPDVQGVPEADDSFAISFNNLTGWKLEKLNGTERIMLYNASGESDKGAVKKYSIREFFPNGSPPPPLRNFNLFVISKFRGGPGPIIRCFVPPNTKFEEKVPPKKRDCDKA